MHTHPSNPSVALPDSETHLHVCGSCGSQLVQPDDLARAGASYWQITLRCPECEWSGTGVFDDESVARLEIAMEAAQDALVSDLVTLARTNFEAEAEAFIAALHAGHIVPEDF